MPWAVTKPRSAWLAQAKDAWAALAPQAPEVARLIEALAALKPGEVSQELQDLAGLRPVGEVVGMPDRGDMDTDDVEDW